VNKTKAVNELTDMEGQWHGLRPDLRVIWKSLQRVENYVENLQAQLERARTNMAEGARKPRSR
jgi:hypothetical protein